MVKKKVDGRVRGLIEHGVRENHRSLFVLVGDHGKDQVENLHKVLSKTRVKARPSVLWCYKKELGFSTHRKKRIKEIKRNQARGLHDSERDDPFDLFISSTDIRWTYYKETDKILGQTFGMCVLQDFEAITPNLLARTIETVEGGGLVIILLKTVKSLKQLYTLSMDVHSRFRTEAHHEVVPRFNERFILSLGDCHGCLVLDDELNILPISSSVNYLPTSTYENSEIESSGRREGESDMSGYHFDPELQSLKASLTDSPKIGPLVEITRTLDQAKALLSFLDSVSERTKRSTVSLTAGRGRGKSAAIGLCLAGAIAYGYSNVFVTAPAPENLKTVFQFVISGLKAIRYTEHLDFEVIQENYNEVGKVVVRINIFRDHRQTIQYILPSDHIKLAQAELVAIDEAAAIPLPTVKKLMGSGSYLVFLSSTINGYEGTGRSLSLKLIQQLRSRQGEAAAAAAIQAGAAVAGSKHHKAGEKERHLHEDRWKVSADSAATSSGSRSLVEVTLTTPIRYSTNDPVEKWLNALLCMDVTANSTRMVGVMPAPKDCELYIVNRDALFSYHTLSEALLQRIWALYTSAHYKSSPNDLQMLSDAPAHRIFVLLGPQNKASNQNQKPKNGPDLPDILCVVQIAFEGMISSKSVQSELSKGNKASGDMIPWIISTQFNDNEFSTLSGARVIRIATHPDVQKMGYGSRAIDLLNSYFQGDLTISTLDPSSGVFGGEGAEDVETLRNDKFDDENVYSLHSEEIKTRIKLPSLLTPVADRPAEKLHWFGASFGLTVPLLNFWSRKGFKVCYVRQTCNELTGEYSSIVLKELSVGEGLLCYPNKPNMTIKEGWLNMFVSDYRNRIINLLGFTFSSLESALAITLIDPDRKLTSSQSDEDNNALVTKPMDHEIVPNENNRSTNTSPITAAELLNVHLSYHDMKRLELYARNMVDHHMIIDTLPTLSRLLFQGRLPSIRLSYLQVAILIATGLQHRDVDSISLELDLPSNQVLAFFNKTIRKITSYLKDLIENETAVSLKLPSKEIISKMEKKADNMNSLSNSLEIDQNADEHDFATKSMKKKLIMSSKDLNQHSISAKLSDLEEALDKGIIKQNNIPKLVSVPKIDKVETSTLPEDDDDDNIDYNAVSEKKTKNKDKKKKRKSKDNEDPNSELVNDNEDVNISKNSFHSKKSKKGN